MSYLDHKQITSQRKERNGANDYNPQETDAMNPQSIVAGIGEVHKKQRNIPDEVKSYEIEVRPVVCFIVCNFAMYLMMARENLVWSELEVHSGMVLLTNTLNMLVTKIMF